MTVAMMISLIPSMGLTAFAADWSLGASDPGQTYNLTLTTANQDQVREIVAAAKWNDVINITVSGEVYLKQQISNDRGTTISLIGENNATIRAVGQDEGGFFLTTPCADTSPYKNAMFSFGINNVYGEGVAARNEYSTGTNTDYHKLTVKNITFDGNNTASLLNSGYHVNIFENVIFTNSKLDIPGGAVNVASAGPSTFTNCQFVNNVAPTNAIGSFGALYLHSTGKQEVQFTITDCTFDGNTGHSGGAFYVYGDTAYVYVNSGTTFRNNTAGQRGGAIHCHGTVYVDGAKFENNQSGQYGGSVYVSASEDNNGGKYYGAVILNNVDLDKKSTANGSGGGVFVADNGVLFLTGDTKIINNTVPDPSAPDGSVKNNVFVQSTNSRVVCSENFNNSPAGKVRISTSNPYTGKDVVVSNMNVDDAAPNVKLAINHILGYTKNADATTTEANVAAFQYDGEGFTIVDDPDNAGMMMLTFNSNVGNIVFDYNLPGAKADTFSGNVGDPVSVPTVSSSMEGGGATYKFLG